MYTYEEALKESITYFNNDELAARVFVDKYALRDSDNNLLEKTPDDMHRRLVKEFARIEAKKFKKPMTEEEIYDLFKGFKYLCPQGSPMYGIGNPYQYVSIGNCFVLPSPGDSYLSINYTDAQIAQISSRRGGVGWDISGLRPIGMPVKNAAKSTTGAVSFMGRFSNTIREVCQSGRRGASLQSISVHHPEILEFIKCKRNSDKITGSNITVQFTDVFMNAVINDTEYEQKWPIDSDTPKFSRMVNAREIWKEFIISARDYAEPGACFIDTVHRESTGYHHGEVEVSSNPCFVGETLIATADGRNAVSIKQLADENKDIPVYSINQGGMVEIKIGRNPRLTGKQVKIVRVHLDDDTYLDVTPNHKFRLKNGTIKEAKDLESGDSLPRLTKRREKIDKNGKDYYRVYTNTIDTNKNKVFEHRLIAKFYNQDIWDKTYSEEKQNGWINGGLVIHHKDHNGLNNNIDNLEIMTFKDHSKLHADIDTQGEKNGRYSGYTNAQIEEFALKLTQKYGRRISKKEWQLEAKIVGIPVDFTSFRHEWFKTAHELLIYCANKLGFAHTECDPRVVKTLNKMLANGYDARIDNGVVLIKKTCEQCHCEFDTDHLHREQSFCGQLCVMKHTNTNFRHINIKNSLKTKEIKQQHTKEKQTKIYSDLKFSLKRDPLMGEWELACKQNNIPYRVGKKLRFAFKNFKEVEEAGNNYNHKVCKIEYLDELQDVYNITVDDNHTIGVVTNIKNNNYSGIYTFQCGEQYLPKFSSCRLICINLLSYVKNKFTDNAKFDYDLFYKHCYLMQRLADDIVDLELEAIDRIISKINADPEPIEVKQTGLDLWKNIKDTAIRDRRTGCGFTALGDCLAALNIQYASNGSIDITEEIQQIFKFAAYQSSVDMAEELGAFPNFQWDNDIKSTFIQRLLDENKELGDKMKKCGRRNMVLLTIAPTGSVSCMTQTTSGLEPVFMLEYKRRKKVNPHDKNTKVDFVDQSGDSWTEFIVRHKGLQEYIDITGGTLEDSPYFGATANEIDWVAKTRLQGVLQKHIDNSISVTTNLPNDISYDEVDKIYLNAWKEGCKGCTVYRDGCRTGVLVANTEVLPTERPKTLKCDIHHVTSKGNYYFVLIGLVDNKPYEVFAGKNGFLPKDIKTGTITRKSKRIYKAVFDDEDKTELCPITSTCTDHEEAITRLTSALLRSEADLELIVDQLEKVHGDITIFAKCVARVLKKYLSDGNITGQTCTECGSSNIVRQEGCLTCKDCGYGRCG